MILVEVITHRTSIAKYTVAFGTRKEMEDAKSVKIHPGEGVVWTDDPGGINVVCVSHNDSWRPRRRLKPRAALSRPDP